MRNCINQLIAEPSVASAMFEYRFSGNGELSGHNLGNLMLKALDHLSVRPLEAINLIRNLLKVDAFLIRCRNNRSILWPSTMKGTKFTVK
ncbi:putative phosphatase/sulfatase [Klebsiella michiganensis]|uniref:Putative phosphatase/sulfatase n=1 Tax=Klebsiella michiganensis TaxID=1134687 RepID=A0A7H4LWW2_9ENTR|nr:putative phosphatase/sulfatase [Klebsiella michiganensis]